MSAPPGATALLARWEAQQDAFVTRREERFTIVLDALALAVPADALVLDLACGPGSISARVAERFPAMRCVGVDHDPALLRLAAEASQERGTADRCRFLDADLLDPAWPEALASEGVPDAVLSSTALHWLPAPGLVALYETLGRLLAPGALFCNADHLRADTGRETFTRLAAADDAATQQAARSAGADTWEAWFALLEADPAYRPALVERQRRFADRPPNPDLGLGFHVEALRSAGFAEAGPVWQHLDDYVVLARR